MGSFGLFELRVGLQFSRAEGASSGNLAGAEPRFRV